MCRLDQLDLRSTRHLGLRLHRLLLGRAAAFAPSVTTACSSAPSIAHPASSDCAPRATLPLNPTATAAASRGATAVATALPTTAGTTARATARAAFATASALSDRTATAPAP